jgi:hypothetical protein
MSRKLAALAVIAGAVLFGQVKTDVPAENAEKKIDRAEAYYQYALACMYANSGHHDSENMRKAAEHYKAAVKADPSTPIPYPSSRPLEPFQVYRPGQIPPQHDGPHDGPGSK